MGIWVEDSLKCTQGAEGCYQYPFTLAEKEGSLPGFWWEQGLKA